MRHIIHLDIYRKFLYFVYVVDVQIARHIVNLILLFICKAQTGLTTYKSRDKLSSAYL